LGIGGKSEIEDQRLVDTPMMPKSPNSINGREINIIFLFPMTNRQTHKPIGALDLVLRPHFSKFVVVIIVGLFALGRICFSDVRQERLVTKKNNLGEFCRIGG